MRKIFARLSLLAACVLGLGSCNLDMTDTYTFSGIIYYEIAEEETVDAVKDYILDVINLDESYSFTGPQYDAQVFGTEKLVKVTEAVDGEYLTSILGDEDVVQYVMYMTGKKINTPLGSVTWYGKASEDSDGDSDGGSEETNS